MNVLYTDVQLRPFDPVFLKISLRDKKLETSSSCKEESRRCWELSPHTKTGIVTHWYNICTQRYKCVKKCVCFGAYGQRELFLQPQPHPLSIPLCIWSYYCETCPFFFCFVCVCARVHTHTHCWSSRCLRCVKLRMSTHAGRQEVSSLWAHSLKVCGGFMKANLKRRRKKY